MALLLTSIPLPTFAEDGLIRMFAGCAGRLSAEMEHSWLLRQPSDTLQAQRNAMISLLDAVASADQRSEILNMRIDAKVAHAALLQRATFNLDDQDANWAANRAEVELAQCTALVLS